MRTVRALGKEGVRIELERKVRHPVDRLVWEALVEDDYIQDFLLTGEKEAWDTLVKRCQIEETRYARAKSDSGPRVRPVVASTYPRDAALAILFRTQAEAYARFMAAERGVVEYRHDVLRDQLLAPEAVPSFLHSQLIAGARNPIDPNDLQFFIHTDTVAMMSRSIVPIDERRLLVAKTAEWPDRPHGGDPEEWSHNRIQEEGLLWVYSVPLLEGKVPSLHRLWMLGQLLQRDYPWHPSQVTAFVLTGEVPTVPGVRFRSWQGWAGNYNLPLPPANRLILDVDATLSARLVSRIFLDMQREIGVAPPRRMTERRATLGRFHMQHLHEGRWRDRMDAWNKAYPMWTYKDERNFRRDALGAYKRLTMSTRTGDEWRKS